MFSFEWHHTDIQRELDNLVVEAHDALNDLHFSLSRYVNYSADTSIIQQLFGKAQRRYICKFCPNVAQSTGNICGARLDSRDLHLRTCKINNVHHQKHEALRFWFKDFVKQAHIKTAPAPPISEVSQRNPTKQLAKTTCS